MQAHAPSPTTSQVYKALWLGFLGVIGFGMTVPATRIAVAELEPLLVTVVRSEIAALCALVVVVAMRRRPPPLREWPRYGAYASMCVFGYPVMMGFAMRYAPAAHASVVLALQPVLTAIASMVVTGERPSPAFWAFSVLGTAVAVLYAVITSAGSAPLQWADLLLAIASVCGSCGYALGGRLSMSRPGWEVISWTVIIAAPFMALLLLAIEGPVEFGASASAWAAVMFVGSVSMYLAFFPWNRGLVLGGIARVGQVQLLQPFVTLAAAWLLVGEHVGWLEVGFCVAMVAIVAAGSRMRVGHSG